MIRQTLIAIRRSSIAANVANQPMLPVLTCSTARKLRQMSNPAFGPHAAIPLVNSISL
jgi:hypothetical protein